MHHHSGGTFSVRTNAADGRQRLQLCHSPPSFVAVTTSDTSALKALTQESRSRQNSGANRGGSKSLSTTPVRELLSSHGVYGGGVAASKSFARSIDGEGLAQKVSKIAAGSSTSATTTTTTSKEQKISKKEKLLPQCSSPLDKIIARPTPVSKPNHPIPIAPANHHHLLHTSSSVHHLQQRSAPASPLGGGLSAAALIANQRLAAPVSLLGTANNQYQNFLNSSAASQVAALSSLLSSSIVPFSHHSSLSAYAAGLPFISPGLGLLQGAAAAVTPTNYLPISIGSNATTASAVPAAGSTLGERNLANLSSLSGSAFGVVGPRNSLKRAASPPPPSSIGLTKMARSE